MSPASGKRHPAPLPALRRVRLSPGHERAVVASAALLALSGVAWLVAHYGFRQQGDFGELPSPAEPWCLRVHGAAMLAFLLVLGSLVPNHIQHGWQTRRNRPSGIGLLAVCAVLTLSGYGLYYIAAEDLRPAISLLHWGLGLLSVLALPLHMALGKRRLIRGEGKG